jgi:hypothetical protein
MKGLAMMLARKMPPPGGRARAEEGDDAAEEADEGEPATEGGDDEGAEAADMSAMEDLQAARKAGNLKGELAALKEIIRNCMAEEKDGEGGY